MHTNSLKRKALALAAVLLLSVPSAIGVQHALAPTRGPIAAWMGAAGFEAVYLSTRVLVMSARPGRFVKDVAIDLPEPRDDATRESARFFELVNAVREALHAGATGAAAAR